MQNRLAFFVLFAVLAAPLVYVETTQARGLEKRFEFGRLPLGADIYKVPYWAVESDCKSRKGLADCRFLDVDGVSYDIFDGFVCTKTFHVVVSNRHRLPYGIRFESSKSEVVAFLSRKLKLKFTDNDGRTVESDDLGAKGFDGTAIILGFDRNNKIASIELWSLCT